MSKIKRKYVTLDNTADGLNAQVLPTSYSPTSYTNTDAFVKGHLQGIDSALSSVPVGSPGDINETSFALSNNISTPTTITGLAFSSSTVRSFRLLISVFIDATADLAQVFDIIGINTGTDWKLSITSAGDDSGITLSIDSSGQFKYTSTSVTGHTSGTLKFRAQTTSV